MKRTFKIKLLLIEIWFCYFRKRSETDFSISIELPERIKRMIFNELGEQKQTRKQSSKLKKVA